MLIGNIVTGTFLRRYKRFFADCRLDTGEEVTAHLANPGSMRSLLHEGGRVWLETNDSPTRKLKYSVQLMQMPNGALVCVNTMLANKLVAEALSNRKIAGFQNLTGFKAEVPYGKEKSRIDFLISLNEQDHYLEVKSATLVEDVV